jgi:hypothetical protein
MSPRAQALAEEFERVNEEFSAYLSQLSEKEWLTVCPNEERTVAALAHHVAAGYLFELRSFKGIAAGEPLPVVTKEYLDSSNAELGEKHANVDRGEVLAMLRQSGAVAAEFVRGLSDEQLQRVGEYIDWVPAMSLEQWIERVLIGHIQMHEASMRAVVEQPPQPVEHA